MRRVYSGHLANQRGSSLILALTMMGGLLISSFFLTDYLIVQKKQVLRNVEAPQRRLVLHSALDYVIFGIKQRWCFSSTLLPDVECGLQNDRSVERLLMSAEQEIFLKDLRAKGIISETLPTQLRLYEIQMDVEVSAMNSTHPLFKVIRGISKDDVEWVRVHIARDTSTTLPQTGRDLYLRITITLLDQGREVIHLGSSPMEAQTLISVHPRELGSFALIVPKSLYLNRATPPTAGDVAFAPLTSSPGPGLIFDSPVFVNRDIHLPDASEQSVYSPVTFSGRVFMGDGRVYQNGAPFEPKAPGGEDHRLWSDHKQFGGFLRGLENDGARDAGLDYFADPTGSLSIDPSRMQACIQRNLIRSDRSYVVNSKLLAQNLNQQGNAMNYRLGLSYSNEFSPQSNAVHPIAKGNWLGQAQRQLNTASDKAVLNIEVSIGGQSVSAQLTKDSSLEVTLDMQYKEAHDNIAAQIEARNQEINQKQTELADLEKDIARAAQDVDDAKERLNKAIADDLSPTHISILRDQLKAAETKLSSAQAKATPVKNAINDLKAQNAAANSKKQFLANILANPPTLQLSTTSISIGGYVQPHLMSLRMDFNNGANFRDLNGNLLQPLIRTQVYDATFFESKPISTENTKLAGYFRPQIKEDGSINYPTGIYESLGAMSPVNSVISIADNYGELDSICNTQAIATSGSAFGGASWDVNFAQNTRHSWNFAGTESATNPAPAPILPQLIFDNGNARPGVATFQVRSIVGECRITSGATFVAGFLACDRLVIAPRSQPLRIIGSIIASRVDIDASAFRSGIRWSNLYHPQSTLDLRGAGILKPVNAASCDVMQNPIWHPIPSMIEVQDRFLCSALSLRARANPFQWTAVDPDCGYIAGNPSQTCKNRLVRFMLVEHSRESKL